MLIRYKKGEDGSNIPVAHVYTAQEHPIKGTSIDKDALAVVKKLQEAGAEAYIVGGAVRDLLLNHIPKDFDIATSATPRQIQKLFWNARIIGKRFRLVHLIFRDKVFEVSTFRSGDEESIYGTVEQDAKRRDFSLNSLYYNPVTGDLLDFNRAMDDIKKGRIRSVIPLTTSFIDDPVRMVRAVKYSVFTGFYLERDIKRSIRKNRYELTKVSNSRVTEEVFKVLYSGEAAPIMRQLNKHQLLVYLLPCIAVSANLEEIFNQLESLDEKVKKLIELNRNTRLDSLRGEMLLHLVRPIILPIKQDEEVSVSELFKATYAQIKRLINPITPPNYDVEQATLLLLKGEGVNVPPTCLRTKPPLQQYGQLRAAQSRGRRRPKRV